MARSVKRRGCRCLGLGYERLSHTPGFLVPEIQARYPFDIATRLRSRRCAEMRTIRYPGYIAMGAAATSMALFFERFAIGYCLVIAVSVSGVLGVDMFRR